MLPIIEDYSAAQFKCSAIYIAIIICMAILVCTNNSLYSHELMLYVCMQVGFNDQLGVSVISIHTCMCHEVSDKDTYTRKSMHTSIEGSTFVSSSLHSIGKGRPTHKPGAPYFSAG